MQANSQQTMRSLWRRSVVRLSITAALASVFSVSITSATFANSTVDANAAIGHAFSVENESANNPENFNVNIAMNRNPSRREQALTIVDNNS